MITDNPSERTQRYRGVSYVKPIDAAKEAVSVEELADELTSGPRGRYRRCPLPDHPDRNPSFALYPDTNSWFCHGCLRGGDVVRLAQLAWEYDERDSHIAAAEVLLMFGHQPPERPASWSRKQHRHKKTRDAIEQARFEHVRRRLFRIFFKELVTGIEDEQEREAEYRILWDATRPLAKKLLADLPRSA
jgi:hypothetical protein